MSDFGSIRSRVQHELFAGLPAQVGRLGWAAATIADWQLSRLRGLLGYALDRSPFHARRLAGVDPDGFRLADLATLPVMTKADMMAQWDDVVTDPRLTLAAAERALAATRAQPVPVLGEYLCLATGGSSGRRGVFASDAAAIAGFCGLLMRPAVARSAAPARGRAGRPGQPGRGIRRSRISGSRNAPLHRDPGGQPGDLPPGAGHAAAGAGGGRAERAAGPVPVRLPEHARAARRGAAGRPAPDQPAGDHRHQRDPPPG